MWQVPALSIAAQAFLLTIALSHDTSQTGRLISTALAVATSGISMQLMAKHRYMERIDTQLLEMFEEKYHIPFNLHSRLPIRQEAAGLSFRPINMFLVRQRSFRIWMVVLLALALLSASLFVVSLVDVQALS